jgi:hypothetical protein
MGQRDRQLWPVARPHRTPGATGNLHGPEQRRHQRRILGAGVARRIRPAFRTVHHRAGRRHGDAADPHQRLHRNRHHRHHRAVLCQPEIRRSPSSDGVGLWISATGSHLPTRVEPRIRWPETVHNRGAHLDRRALLYHPRRSHRLRLGEPVARCVSYNSRCVSYNSNSR